MRTYLTSCVAVTILSSVVTSSIAQGVCEKYEVDGPNEVTKCVAEQADAKRSVWASLIAAGIKTTAELDAEAKAGEPFAVAAKWCIDVDAADDWTRAAWCFKTSLKQRQAAAEARRKCLAAGASPVIGMTYEQAIATCWGKPTTINRTTVEGHVRDQAVYAGQGRFLYFDNGKLVSIQEPAAP